MGIGKFIRGLVAGRPGWTALAAAAALGVLVVPQVGASDYLGGGQQADTNAFLNPEVITVKDVFVPNPDTLIRVPILQAVTLVPFVDAQGTPPMAEMEFKFSSTVDYTTFEAFLGKLQLSTEPLDPINPQNGVRVLNIPISSGRNTVVATVVGLKPGSSQRARDTDRVTMICCVPFHEQPPTADAGPDQLVFSGATVTLNGSGSDPNDDSLSFQWEQVSGPPVTLSSSAAASPTFRAPITLDVGVDLEFDLSVNDGIWTSFTDRVRITVTPGVPPPIANAGLDQVRVSGELVTLDGTGSVSFTPGGTYTCAWQCPPGVSLSDPNACVTTFIAPPVTEMTVLTCDLTVTDSGGQTDTDSVNVTVNPPNQNPTVTASASPNPACGNQAVILSASANDADGDPLSYQWTQTAGSPQVTISGAHQPTAGFIAPVVPNDTTLTFRVTVTDGRGGSAEAFVDVLVYGTGNCPGTTAASGLSVLKPLSLTRRAR